MTLRKALHLGLGLLVGASLAACGPVTANTIDCEDQAACGSHGTCDDSSGTARCICEQGYAGATCDLCDSGYERDSNGNCAVIVTCESACAAQGRVCASIEGDIICGDCLQGWFEENGRCIQACDAVSHTGELVPLDIYIMLDRSSSMDESGKWGAVTSAISTFVNSSETVGIGVGLQFFPVDPSATIPGACTTSADCGLYGPCMPWISGNVCSGSLAPDTSCDPADYDDAAVPIAELPGVASAITSAIGNNGPEGSATPTEPAMSGAVTYATAWAAAHPMHLTYIVYATDGEPTGCSENSVSGAASLAADALAGNPSVPTYVFGVGDGLDALNEIANAGGTGTAILVGSGGTVTQTFIDTLNEIRANGLCKYQLPEPTQGTFDPTLINVSLVDPGPPESAETVYNVPDSSGCDATGGWYYDDPQSPTMIQLCPATCDEVSLQGLSVDIVVGCQTIVK